MIDPAALPMRYDELPELGDLGARHAWNVWPNSLGTLNRITSESVLDVLAIPRISLHPQASSRWDSLRHIRAGRFGHLRGASGPELGNDAYVGHGLMMRGVLLDLPAHGGQQFDAFTERSITAAERAACAGRARQVPE